MLRKSALLFFALSGCALAAAVYLLFDVSRGIPFRFETELALAAVFAVLLPLVAVALVRRFGPWTERPYAGYVAYIGTALLGALVFGVSALL